MSKIRHQIDEALLALTGDVPREYEQVLRAHREAAAKRQNASSSIEAHGLKLLALCRRRFSQILATHYTQLYFGSDGFVINYGNDPWRINPFITVTVHLRAAVWTITRTFWPRSANDIDDVARQIKKMAEAVAV